MEKRQYRSRAILTNSEISKIVEMFEDGIPKSTLEREFNISRTTLDKYILKSKEGKEGIDQELENIKKICSKKEREINKLNSKIEKLQEENEEYKIQNEFLKIEVKKYLKIIRRI